MVQGRGAQLHERLAVPGHRIGRVLVDEHLRTAVLVDPNRFHGIILS
jgi:hypothetical protein